MAALTGAGADRGAGPHRGRDDAAGVPLGRRGAPARRHASPPSAGTCPAGLDRRPPGPARAGCRSPSASRSASAPGPWPGRPGPASTEDGASGYSTVGVAAVHGRGRGPRGRRVRRACRACCREGAPASRVAGRSTSPRAPSASACSSATSARCSRSPAVRRVFAYHGAEHMTIHAYEHGEPLDARPHPDLRPPPPALRHELPARSSRSCRSRCTSSSATPAGRLLVASRDLGLPVVAALAYEVDPGGRPPPRLAARPGPRGAGLWLQSITTREPDDDQIEVAVAALRATLDGRPGGGPLMLAPPPRRAHPLPQKVVLVAALVAGLVEIAGLLELIPRLAPRPAAASRRRSSPRSGRARPAGPAHRRPGPRHRRRRHVLGHRSWPACCLSMVLLDREGHLVDCVRDRPRRPRRGDRLPLRGTDRHRRGSCSCSTSRAGRLG